MTSVARNSRYHFVVVAVLLSTASTSVSSGAELDLSNRRPDLNGYKVEVTPLLESYCLACHDNATQEGGLSLEGIDANLVAGEQLETWRLIAEQVRFGMMPPQDADQPAAKERAMLLDWIRGELRKGQLPGAQSHEKLALPQFGNYVDHEALFGERLDRVYPAAPRLWRLRPDIYDTTMPRLGENISGLANGLSVADDPEFKDYAAPYALDEGATAPLLGNAKKIAAALVGERSKDRIFKRLVEDVAPQSETVAEAVNYAFYKILGRAATDEERERFSTYHREASKIGGHHVAANALLTAVLMQPEVLYRQELGDGKPDKYGRMRLSQRELAYALSFALENEPIREFVEAAQQEKLATRDQLAALIRQRLHDDSLLQAKNARLMQFFREYFNYPFASEVFKDAPAGGTHEPGWLIGDLELTIRDILQSDQNVLRELLTTRHYYVMTQRKVDKNKGIVLEITHSQQQKKYHTAYSLPYDWKWAVHLQPVSFPADERAGVLTHPAWLAAWSGNFENHPVQRGKWIRTHLLGGTVPDVPIGVDARVPEKEHTTFRNRLAMATSKAECWRCHQKMDPLGVPFERYDHYGRYQRLDAGQPVDASGKITFTGVTELDGAEVNSPVELMEQLAQSEHVEQVFVRYAFRYFLGRNETLGDANTLQDAHEAYRDSGGSFRALVVSLLCSDSFTMRQSPTGNGN